MKQSIAAGLFVLLIAGAVSLAHAGDIDSNPHSRLGVPIHPGTPAQGGLTPFTDHAAWAAAAGATTLIDFEVFASGTLITTQLSSYCITLVSGTSENEVPPGATDQFVTSSAAMPFPMFTAGTLPSEPNFLSNDMTFPGGPAATGTITFQLAGPTTAIGAFVADGAPLGNFRIEVFDGNTSLGTITVGPRTLPDSFAGVVSDTAFDSAKFFADSGFDSWGLDNMEHNCANATPVETTTWGKIKTQYDR